MTARITQQPKSSMQSGQARTGQWQLVIERAEAQRHDPLTGWIGSGDTDVQIVLSFPTEAAAVAYADTQGLSFEIVRLPPKQLRLQAYADNFR